MLALVDAEGGGGGDVVVVAAADGVAADGVAAAVVGHFGGRVVHLDVGISVGHVCTARPNTKDKRRTA